MNPWLLAALIAAALIAFLAIVWLLYIGRQTFGALVRRIDNRGWFSIGLFALASAIFAMLGLNPALQDNKLFDTLAEAIIITGLINLAGGYLYGASKRETPAPTEPAAAKPPIE